MKYLLLLMVSCFSFANAGACVTYNPNSNTYTVDASGCVKK